MKKNSKKTVFPGKLRKIVGFSKKKKKTDLENHEANLCSKFQKVWLTGSGRKSGNRF